jgi:hypothetical protein
MAEEILVVLLCKQNFGHGVIFPLTASIYLYVGLQRLFCVSLYGSVKNS